MATTNEIILGILMTVTYSFVTNRVLMMGGGQVQFMIFSEHIEEIHKTLLDMDFGVTMLHGKSGYQGKEIDVLITAMSYRYMNGVKDQVLRIDPQAFMTISSIREIDGRGFTISDK